MGKRKKMRERGKIKFSEYFKKLNEGDRVAIKEEKSVRAVFPKRVQGRTGVVTGTRGKNYIVKLKEFSKEKIFIMPSIHLKKIKENVK
ncbi:50S ribosomal protein L21e [Candidatus Pacearchaeota archaeon]|nr:50S ribosomal protein L21e [Candidatus Pacearchaeota archaeon]|tara:strand:- start:4282 stop:4545 length:264 start_codon:yes stop_codon:yes gene_type:complete